MSRMWHNARGSGLFSSALSVLVILGTSAAMAKSNDPSPHRARDAIGAQARSADGVTSSVTAPEIGGIASGATVVAAGAELTGAGSGTSPRQGPVRATTASCGGTVSSIDGNLPRAKDRAGISVAISRVRANCAREPQASGLLRALQRLAQHSRPGSSGPGHGNRHASGHGNGHAYGHGGGIGNGHAGAGNPGKGHPNHGNSTTTGNAGGGGKGKGAGR